VSKGKEIAVLVTLYRIHSTCHDTANISPIGQTTSIHLDILILNFDTQEWGPFPSDTCESI